MYTLNKNNTMKQYILVLLIVSMGFTFHSCDDLLDVHIPGQTSVDQYFKTLGAGEQAVNAAYAPLTWEFNNTYYPEWFIGDVVSDDALKGGQSVLTDMGAVYELENFRTQSSNEYLLEYYQAQYMGIFRANLVLEQVPNIEVETDADIKLKERILGEAHFLRAYYYFRLVRLFGGVPKIDFVIKSQFNWKQPRATAEEIYSLIYSDLEFAQKTLPLKNKYAAEDAGRATKGAAQAMLMKAYMNNHEYDKAKAWGDSIINSGQYKLLTNYADNFTIEGENGLESVFEVQYIEDPTGDYGDSNIGGNGFTRGTFTVILTRARSGGWGFNRPTQELYNEYEVFGDKVDPRREMTIYDPTKDGETNPELWYMGNTYHSRKYALIDQAGNYTWTGHASRGPINRKEIRYSDILLMYAEASIETGKTDRAKWALEEVRKRARGGDSSILPPFPYGSYTDSKEDLTKAVRHERRVELGMEGQRWFDLIRWGVAAKTMNDYRENTTPEISQYMLPFVEGKHELFPIPLREIEKNPMAQNPKY